MMILYVIITNKSHDMYDATYRVIYYLLYIIIIIIP